MTRAADLAKLIAGGGSITVADNSENLKLITTDADASVGPTLRMDRQSASAADSDLLGKINFVGHNDAGTPEDIGYAGITAIIGDASDGTEDGKLAINTMVAGTETSRIFIDAGETVFNENGVNVDFRVESDGLTNAFVIDAGNNGIGFGISPRSDLHTSATQMFLGLDGGIISQRDSGLGINGVSLTQNVYIDSDTGNYAYMNTDEASKIHLNDGTIRFDRTASGTAGNAITFSESMRIDASGQVGIGTTSPSRTFHVSSSSGTAIKVETSDNDKALIEFANNGTSTTCFLGSADDAMQFGAGGSERMRIDSSGHILFGGKTAIPTTNGGTGFDPDTNGRMTLHIGSSSTGLQSLVFFNNGNGLVGTIQVNGSSTAFNTSSDYRLKENVVTDWDATTRLKQLKPSRFNFKADKDTTVDGFLAHEVSSIVPEAISGEKDAVDADGNIEPQGIDQSKLVPLMVKTIQELEARIATLESK